MVVDDAVVVRGLLTRWIEAEAGLHIVGSMRSGREAIEQLERANPDVVILDVDMPDTDGITALPMLLEKKRDLIVIMASTLTRRNAEISLRALALGAADYIPKPQTTREITTSTSFRRELIDKIRALGSRRKPVMPAAPAAVRGDERYGEAALRRVASPSLAPQLIVPQLQEHGLLKLRPLPLMTPRVLLIGASTGGPQALNRMLAQVSSVIDHAPVLVVQHMPPTFTTILAEHLTRAVGRPAHEAVDGEEVRAGQIYIAPGGHHMRVVRRAGNPTIAIEDGPLVNFCKPAVDPLFDYGCRDLGRQESRDRADGNGFRRHARRCEPGRGRGRDHCAGRGIERRVGHAGLGCERRTLLRRSAARPDRADNRSSVRGGSLVTPHDYDFIRKLVRERSGLVLSADKQYLVESRLLPVARKAALVSLSDLVRRLKEPNTQALAVEVVEAMMTNESFFFRDKLPFEHFRETIIPALIAARASQRRIRIWCAAASTGQEPYSLAMCLKEMAQQLAGWRIDILATDISNEVLEKAKAGIYSQFEVQRGLPIQMLIKYFTQVGETWQIAPEIRAMVQFRPFNLLNDFAGLGMFDIVFCRNVLIYFDQPTKVGVLDRIARTVERDGYLVLGAAETVVGLTDSFKPVPERRGLYSPNTGVRAAAPRLAVVGAR